MNPSWDLKSACDAGVRTLRDAFGSPPPDVAVILGSGLGSFADRLQDRKSISYTEIPNFPKPTVQGHVGECSVGKIENRRVLVYRGRFHYYEGHPLPLVTLPVRIAALWGIKTLIVTNAAGAIRKDLHPGGLLLLKDHINFMGTNPCVGPIPEEYGPRFFDMTQAYDGDFREHARTISRKNRIPLPEGTYVAVPGPSYETPAEIKMFGMHGGDAIGMSTVPEVIVARQHGMRVLGLSFLTNYAAGVLGLASDPITHEEVLENTKKAGDTFNLFLTSWIGTYEG